MISSHHQSSPTSLPGRTEIPIRLTPKQAPNCNAYAERFVLSIKSECLRRMIFFGERRFRAAVSSYVAHYHTERAHQGLGNERLEQRSEVGTGEVLAPSASAACSSAIAAWRSQAAGCGR